jgi:hypothetical protein
MKAKRSSRKREHSLNDKSEKQSCHIPKIWNVKINKIGTILVCLELKKYTRN